MDEEQTQAGTRTTAKIIDSMLSTQDETDEHMQVHLFFFSFRVVITTFIENYLVDASSSNGVVDRRVQALEGMIRVLQDAPGTRWCVKL